MAEQKGLRSVVDDEFLLFRVGEMVWIERIIIINCPVRASLDVDPMARRSQTPPTVGTEPTDGTDFATTDVPRRTVLRLAGGASALGLTAGVASASSGATDESSLAQTDLDDAWADEHESDGTDEWSSPTADDLDPLFGYPSGGPNPCMGDVGDDCLAAWNEAVRPVAEVSFGIDLPGLLFGAAESGALSEETLGTINAAAADGDVDTNSLHKPDEVIDELSSPEQPVRVRDLATTLADTTGFFFDPAGLHVTPGSVVLFSAETPDHSVASYHDRHGRQNRVPDDVGPFSSPLVPVGGSWLYRFDEPGVYDYYCPPHEPFGMVGRIVVAEEGADAPEPSIEQTGRPPAESNEIAGILGGFDPNLPSSMGAFETDALDPQHIVDEGRVSWADVVASHRAKTSAE